MRDRLNCPNYSSPIEPYKGTMIISVSPDYARREIVDRLIKNGEVIVRLKDIGRDGVVGFELLSEPLPSAQSIDQKESHRCINCYYGGRPTYKFPCCSCNNLNKWESLRKDK